MSSMVEHPTNDQIFIRKLTDITLANLGNETFGVKELLHRSGMTYFSLSRRLHKITNKTINQFIRDTRLQKALEMLRNEKITASEVAYKVGFGSPSYFNTCFHEFFGYPPGSVKKGDFHNIEEINPVRVVTKQKQKRPTRYSIIFASSGLFLLAIIFYLAYNLFLKNSSTYAGSLLKSPGKSLAVLPFKNLSDSTANKYFIDGVMEDILTNLSKIHDLRVISRTSVEQFRESTISTSEIAKKLNVDYIVEGSCQKYGNEFCLRIQLIEASTDRHLWAEPYEQEIKESKDIFRIQSHVAQEIALALKAIITPEEKLAIEKAPTTSLTAYDFYLRGEEEMKKYEMGAVNREAVKKAEILFKKALEYDSTFARAYTGLAIVYWKNALFEENVSRSFLDSMLVLANVALSYDNQLAGAYYVRGGYYASKGNPDKATEEYDKAIRFNPNDWQAYWGKGWLFADDILKSIENFQKAASLMHGYQLPELLRTISSQYYQAGFPEKGKDYDLEALNLDRDSCEYLNNLVWFENSNGKFKKALELLNRIYIIDSTYSDLNENFGMIYMYSGQFKESLKYFNKWMEKQKAIRIVPYSNRMTWIGYVYRENGYKKEAEYYLNKRMQDCYNSINSYPNSQYLKYEYFDLASIYAFRGEKIKAFQNLRMFINKSQMATLSSVTDIKTNPLFNNIRNESEFQQIVKEMEAKYQAEHERVRKWLEEQGML
jgi:TolB-like protein/AraC-like DNA-binding protein/Tfp pilus assembly protein PilF